MPVVLATNRAGHNALQTHRKRWGIEMVFADSTTRGLNFKDTRLTDAAKLHLLTALALAGANRAARVVLRRAAPARKAHGYLEKSCFRPGFDYLKTQPRTDPEKAVRLWENSAISQSSGRVV